jgi:hypothetical protein
MKAKRLKMDFVSSSVLDEKTKKGRINFILNRVKDGSILVTDAFLHPQEEVDLIKETMRRVDDGFPGIEVCSLKKQTKGLQFLVERLIDQKDRIQKFFSSLRGRSSSKSSLKTGITLIGPAKIIKRIKKNPDSFSIMAEV